MSFEEEGGGSDTGSDDAEFMEKVNVYLNSRNSMNSSSTALEGILRRNSTFNSKVVKFEMDEEELEDAKLDADRSRQELLAKIARLTDLLKDAENQITMERDKRKKKEKNLMKLAKELKKRNQQKENDMDRLEELEEKKKYLEHHWVLAQKELDQEKVFRDKMQNESTQDFESALAGEKEKHAKTYKENEERVSELKKAHQKQCDELCREILKANLEADRLHSQLNNGSTRKTKVFSDGSPASSGTSPVFFILSILLALIVFVGYNVDMFTLDAACAPVMPGMALNSINTGSVFEAPWWAPSSLKAQAFEQVCSDNLSPTVLEWLPDGRENKIVLSSGDKVLFNKRYIVKAEVFGNRLRLWSKKGLAEDHESLWSM